MNEPHKTKNVAGAIPLHEDDKNKRDGTTRSHYNAGEDCRETNEKSGTTGESTIKHQTMRRETARLGGADGQTEGMKVQDENK